MTGAGDDSAASIWPQAGNDAEKEWQMRARWGGNGQRDYLTDAFAQLQGWTRDDREIRRTLHLDDSQHAAMTECIKVVADALQLRPEVRRLDGHTQIRLQSPEGDSLSAGEVTLAARIEDLYKRITDAA
jgi:4a-hydroxytetrahydrobiopterin dehydratase